MKKLTLCLLASFALLQLHAAETWLTDLPKAQAKAKAEKKIVLVDFTGSDWCIWCKRLDAEVFSTKEFAKYAKTDLVLVKLDFPQNKPQSDELKKTNQALLKKYNPDGAFPTLVVFNGDGKKLGQFGYVEGPKAFIAELDKLKKF
jgi:thiol:disulfide interchange protein